MKFEFSKVLSITIASLLSLGSAHARIVGGVQNKNQDNERKIPRVYNPQQSQRTPGSRYSSERKFSSREGNNNSRSKNSSNNRSNNKPNNNKPTSKKPSQHSNPTVSTQRVIPRVNTNSSSIAIRSQVATRQSNPSNKNSNNGSKSHKKTPSKAASAPTPRVIPRVNTNTTASQSRITPRVNSNTAAQSAKQKSVVRRISTNQSSHHNARPVGPAHSTHKDGNYSQLRTVGSGISPSAVAGKWNSRDYQSASIWDRARNHDGHDHHADYHHNFSNSLNYAYRPSAWGNDPWWDQHDRHDYHKGCWDYGWNDRYTHRHSLDRNFYPPGYSRPDSSLLGNLAWGLAGWGLGSVVYETGYQTYSNPYPTPPVTYRGLSHSYAEPIAVASASRAPEPDLHVATKEELSVSAMDQARAYFEEGSYESALYEVDQAIAFTPSDPVLHEFRALNLFALERYGDAAGVLNPILASGPGWDWDTLIGFYASEDVYTRQLRRLENYVEFNADSADSRFLLGYHYMVGGYLAEAREMFDQVSRIEPNDSVAAQLRNLAESSMPIEEDDGIPSPAASAEMVTGEFLQGDWRALSSDGKTIMLSIGEDGKFTWDYEGASDGSVLNGEWSIDENGLLVLNDEDVQLAGIIEMDGTNTMRFVLAGTPEGDPGLTFERM